MLYSLPYICPKSVPLFRIKVEVIQDQLFQKCLSETMACWQHVRSFGLDVMSWYENVVKPGVRKLAQKRSREMFKVKQEELNLLRLMQAYFNRKLILGDSGRLA